MKSLVAVLPLLSSALALVPRTNSCCFGLTATGGPGGKVGQLADGQNRIGQGLPPATYCIDNGAITDGNGRGCILTPPSTQFQCDSGATPTPGFSIGCDGSVSYNASTTFWACATGDHGGYNIYTVPVPNQPTCVKISLNADSCHNCPAPAPAPAPVPAPAPAPAPVPAPAPAPKTCPTNLAGNYEFPHLIVPVDSSQPNKAYGTQYSGEVSSTISTIFNFDIPYSDAGKTCSLVFLFPKQSDLQTSSFTFSGSGAIDFSMLSGIATQSTTFANAPTVKTDYGVTTVAPGNSYTIATFPCPANTAVAFEMKSQGGTCLDYFQDYNPSPIGLYITTC